MLFLGRFSTVLEHVGGPRSWQKGGALLALVMEEDQTSVQELEWQERPSTGQHPFHSQIPLDCNMKPHTIMVHPLPTQWMWHHPARLVTKAQSDWCRGFAGKRLVAG